MRPARTILIMQLSNSREIVVLADGKIQEHGPREELMNRVLAGGSVQAACCREEEMCGE